MKPKVFLCHSKLDLEFVEKLASDLRPARVDVWYDDWEIPSGASLRTKIFEEAIPVCDLFFVYLTKNSVNSRWVREELDAAFVREMDSRGGFLALFCDTDATRNSLSLDLRSRRIPAISNENYHQRLLEIVALAWESMARRAANSMKNKSRIELLELKNALLEKDQELNSLRIQQSIDFDKVLLELEQSTLDLFGTVITLRQLLIICAEELALSAEQYSITFILWKRFSPESSRTPIPWPASGIDDLVRWALAKLVLMGLIERRDGRMVDEDRISIYELTRPGLEFLRLPTMQVESDEMPA